MKRTPRIGIALGSGSARGWAHVGVLRALAREGIEPQIISGCSIGAFVGAVAAAGDLEKLGGWVESLGWQDVVGLMDMGLRGGLIKGDKLIGFFERNFVDRDFTALLHSFGCVATDLQSGHEVWLREGSVSAAVRASIALPGLFTPVARADGRLLVDGGIVNPVPTSLARAMGADIVIGVDLNSDILHRHMQPLAVVQTPAPDSDAVPEPEPPKSSGWMQRLTPWRADEPAAADVQRVPSMLDVVMTSVAIMQMRITRSRMAGDPPEVVIAPQLAHLGLMDFYRAEEAIAEGQRAAEKTLPFLQQLGLGAV